MARIVFGSYIIRYPLGGMASHVLQYLVGFRRLGHDVYFVEKSGWSKSCFDPVRNAMSDDCSYGVEFARSLLARFGFAEHWTFVDAAGQYHGLDKQAVKDIFRTADVFIDTVDDSWADEASDIESRVFLDGEPGYNQMRMESGDLDPNGAFNYYYTNGWNLDTHMSSAPTAGRKWRHMPHPVVPSLFDDGPSPAGSPFTTIMNWQSHEAVEYDGATYGQKDVEFERFIDLPHRLDVPLEISVSGSRVPVDLLAGAGWKVRDANDVSITFDSFTGYIQRSMGEFSVAKNVFVALKTGWFSDRSAAYLASGRPVVMQETGFSEHLPVGEGLFAVRSVEEAEAAISEIRRHPRKHEVRAREIAEEYIDTRVVLTRFLDEIGSSASQSRQGDS